MSDNHASEGAEHLQRAARELIGAARSFLDAAEEVVEDRELMSDATETLRGLARELGSAARRTRASSQAGGRDDGLPVDQPGDDQPSTASNAAADSPVGTTESGKGSRSTRVRRIDVE